LFGKWGHPGLGAVKLIGLNYHGVETVEEKQDLRKIDKDMNEEFISQNWKVVSQFVCGEF
jgi:hypothetical protein